MPVYSPPLTRQRARVLLIAQQQEQQQVTASDEQRRRHPGQITRERRRPLTQQQQQRAGTGKESGKPEKAFLYKRAAGTVDSRPRGSRAPAESRSAGSGTLGNLGSRCRKGLLGHHVRRGGRDSDPTRDVDRGNNDLTEGGGQQHQIVNDGEGRPEIVYVSFTSSSGSSCSSSPPVDAFEHGGAQGGSTTRNDVESCLQQPLEEVNSSVLNAKTSFSNGSGCSSSTGVCLGIGEEGGKGGDSGGVTPPSGDVAIDQIGDEGGERFCAAASATSGTSEAQVLAPCHGSGRVQLQGSGSGPGVSLSAVGVSFDSSVSVASRAVGTAVGSGVGSKEMRLSSRKGESTGLRLRGKDVEASAGDDDEQVSSMGASALQKRNRRELKLSEEEVAMAGAPQGPVYQVTVLETSEFEGSPNPEEEMQAVHVAAGGGGDWADMYSAIDSIRRLSIFHAVVISREENLEGAVRLLVSAVGNLRSSMVRNALLAVGDMFRFLGKDMGKVDIRAMMACTLQRVAGDKRFICQTAAQAMEAAARNGPLVPVLGAILLSIDDRNAGVSAKAAHFAEQCLGTLGVGSKAGTGMPENLEFQPLVAGLGRAIGGKLAEGRTAARRGLLRSRKAMGPERFEAAVTKCLPKAEAQALLAALAGPNRDGTRSSGNATLGGSREGRGSIRQHMLAAKRGKMEERRRGAAGIEDSEKVLWS